MRSAKWLAWRWEVCNDAITLYRRVRAAAAVPPIGVGVASRRKGALTPERRETGARVYAPCVSMRRPPGASQQAIVGFRALAPWRRVCTSTARDEQGAPQLSTHPH
jgi:hypothetical protein